jgi:hypothetical protein
MMPGGSESPSQNPTQSTSSTRPRAAPSCTEPHRIVLSGVLGRRVALSGVDVPLT